MYLCGEIKTDIIISIVKYEIYVYSLFFRLIVFPCL